MNKNVIIGLVAVVVVGVGGFFGYQYMQLQAQAKKWAGPHKEIVEEKVTKDGAVTTLHFVSLVDVPLAAVENVLWTPERGQEMIENITLSKLLKSEGNTKLLEMNVRALNLPLQFYTMQFTHDPEHHRISFKTVESQAQDLEGEYVLEPSPDGKSTRVDYTSKSKDKIALPFPQSVVDSANREIFVNTMRGVKKGAQQNAAGSAAPPA
ncbi:MAG: hypothetical protein HYR72_18465 [Deltaproteobacteria bacterium]|nr:hypothetical protein [Deltaproteobacteria bacterium]MBI3386295.1 hypothetical protein [Deltaproteobacteria bacterium]